MEDLAVARHLCTEAFGVPVVFEEPQAAVVRVGDLLVNPLVSAEAADRVATPPRPRPNAAPAWWPADLAGADG